MVKDNDKQTGLKKKTFLGLKVSKMWTFDKNRGLQILHKSDTLSYMIKV